MHPAAEAALRRRRDFLATSGPGRCVGARTATARSALAPGQPLFVSDGWCRVV
ncbi:MAG TPA: hypothetical protein VH092_25730 [Urbifossiella sp.]|jgi:hypothetical protein|nr:hypothetical protein [Urbifossiella sp.]